MVKFHQRLNFRLMLMPLYCTGFSELKDKRKMLNILIKDNEVTLTLRRQKNRGKKNGKAEREREKTHQVKSEERMKRNRYVHKSLMC